MSQEKRTYVRVCLADVRYAYREKEQGMMLETSLTIEFLADDYLSAVEKAYAWGKNRHEQCMKDMYPDCFIGSVTVGEKFIALPGTDGFINTFNSIPFFQWKYDYCDFGEYFESKKRKLGELGKIKFIGDL